MADTVVKILVDVVPQEPEQCPYIQIYTLNDWRRYDCMLRPSHNPTLRSYKSDDKFRRAVESKCHCHLILGKECPFLKSIRSVLTQ